MKAYLTLIFQLVCSAVLVAAADDIDSSCSSSSTSDDSSVRQHVPDVKVTDSEHNLSTWEFMSAFSKLGTSWSHVIGEYRSVIQSADGQDLKGDVYTGNGFGEGLVLIKQMVSEVAAKSDENELIWSFHTSPLSDFGKTVDDLLLAFLRWAVVDNHRTNGHARDDNGCSLIGGINHYPSESEKVNVSKAFRRLTSYTQWMQSVSEDLLISPLTYESVAPSLEIFSIHVTHDKCGRLVWWVDLGKTQIDVLKAQSASETTRMFIYVAHLLFLDNGAQTKGLVVIDDMAQIGFWEYMTMLPLKVGISVDRFLISVTPLKAKNVIMMHRPKWVEIAYGLLSWFLNDRMKSRVTMVENGEEETVLNDAVGGSAFIPFEFSSANGMIEQDLIARNH